MGKQRFTSRIILGYYDEQRYSRYPHQLGAKFPLNNMSVWWLFLMVCITTEQHVEVHWTFDTSIVLFLFHFLNLNLDLWTNQTNLFQKTSFKHQSNIIIVQSTKSCFWIPDSSCEDKTGAGKRSTNLVWQFIDIYLYF